MPDTSEAALSLPVQVSAIVLIGASIGVWLWVAVRAVLGLPVMPYEPRRPVPWRLPEVLAILVVLEMPVLLGLLLGPFLGTAGADATATRVPGKVDVQHPIVDLLRAEAGWAAWLLCGLLAVVVAPIVEEFSYRLVLQGWLEAEERRARRLVAVLRRFPPGMAPIVLVSLLFAMRHFRTAEPPITPDVLIQSMVVHAVWSVLAFGFALMLLRTRSGATAVDLGFVGQRFLADACLGLLGFAAICAPVILLQYVTMVHVLPKDVAADPIPLFPLALVLGTLYYRTHRIVPAIVLHMAFNGANLLLLWLHLRGEGAVTATAGLW